MLLIHIIGRRPTRCARIGHLRATTLPAIVALLALVADVSWLAAQDARLTVEPVVAYRGTTRLYDHSVGAPLTGGSAPGRFESRERLQLTPGVGVGARASFSPAGGWFLFAEGTRTHGRHEFRTSQHTYGEAALPVGDAREEQWTGRAAVLALAAGVGRTIWMPTARTAAAVELRGAVRTRRSHDPLRPLARTISREASRSGSGRSSGCTRDRAERGVPPPRRQRRGRAAAVSGTDVHCAATNCHPALVLGRRAAVNVKRYTARLVPVTDMRPVTTAASP